MTPVAGSKPKSVHHWRCLLINGRRESGRLTQPDLGRLTGQSQLHHHYRTPDITTFSAAVGKRLVSGPLREASKALGRRDEDVIRREEVGDRNPQVGSSFSRRRPHPFIDSVEGS